MDQFVTIKGKKVLLIDDDEWIRDSLGMFFKSEEMHIDAVETAEEGITALSRQRYDIIITDYRLPGMDGLKFLKRVQESNPDSFKILITAYGSRDVISAAAELGVDDYIEKPFTTKTIEDALSRLISKRGKAARTA